MGGDLGSLGDLRWDEKAGQLLALVGKSVIDALAGGSLTEVESLPVSFVSFALCFQRCEEAVLA